MQFVLVTWEILKKQKWLSSYEINPLNFKDFCHEDTKSQREEEMIPLTVEEERIEVIVPREILKEVIEKVKSVHPYEEMAFDIYPLEN